MKVKWKRTNLTKKMNRNNNNNNNDNILEQFLKWLKNCTSSGQTSFNYDVETCWLPSSLRVALSCPRAIIRNPG